MESFEREEPLPTSEFESQEEIVAFDDDETTVTEPKANPRPRRPSYSLRLGPTRLVKVLFAEEVEKESYLVLSERKCV